jgi:hypothetical protein
MIRTLSTMILNCQFTLTTMIRTLRAPVAGRSHAFVRAHACRRAASCRAGSATSAGSTHAAARTRSHPSGGRRCGFRALGALAASAPRLGPLLPHIGLGLERRCRIQVSGLRAADVRARCAGAVGARRARGVVEERARAARVASRRPAEVRAAFSATSAQDRPIRVGRCCRGPLCSAAGTRRSCRPRSCSTTCARARSRSWCTQPSPSADVGGVGPVLVKMWEGWAQSQRRCGTDGPSPGADVGGASPVLAQMWQGSEECARSLALPRGAPLPALPHTVRMRGRATE